MELVKEIITLKQEVNIHEFEKSPAIRSPKDGADFIRDLIGDETQEVFVVIVLNTKNIVTHFYKCFKGSLNASIVHPREVFQIAVRNNAASIIVGHQHPSGNTSASREDVEVTKRLVEGGKILGIDVLDHIIVTFTSQYTSLKEEGIV